MEVISLDKYIASSFFFFFKHMENMLNCQQEEPMKKTRPLLDGYTERVTITFMVWLYLLQTKVPK